MSSSPRRTTVSMQVSFTLWCWTHAIVATERHMAERISSGPIPISRRPNLNGSKPTFDAQQLGYASAIAVLLIFIVFLLSLLILAVGNPMKQRSDI